MSSRIRSASGGGGVVLLVLGVGLLSFVVLHSVVLLLAPAERTHEQFRTLWFVGLMLTVLLSVYVSYTDRSA